MRMLLVCLAPLVTLAAGCDFGKSVSGSSSPFQAKLEAAQAITNTSTRDVALAKVAEDAAAGGDAAVADKAVGKITNTSQHDTAAAAAALKLAAVGKPDEAKDLAKKIINTSARDDALAKIAKGEFSAPPGK